MKRIQNIVFLFFIFFHIMLAHAEGFAPGTSVKVPTGYTKIEELRIGDDVSCYNAENKLVVGQITTFFKKIVDSYVLLTIGAEKICVACDQLVYDIDKDIWVNAASLKNDDALSGYNIKVELINEPIDVYLLSVAQYHNFLVTKTDICAHNFFPLVVGFSVAFGAGSLELAGISAGIAGLGTFLGYKWHKKNKHKHNITISRMSSDIFLESDNMYNLNDAQAPGMPTEKDGFYPPKKWDGKKVKNPNGPGYGWPDKKGSVWIPTGPNGHGCPHWDVEHPDGSYDNVVPGGRIRGKR